MSRLGAGAASCLVVSTPVSGNGVSTGAALSRTVASMSATAAAMLRCVSVAAGVLAAAGASGVLAVLGLRPRREGVAGVGVGVDAGGSTSRVLGRPRRFGVAGASPSLGGSLGVVRGRPRRLGCGSVPSAPFDAVAARRGGLHSRACECGDNGNDHGHRGGVASNGCVGIDGNVGGNVVGTNEQLVGPSILCRHQQCVIHLTTHCSQLLTRKPTTSLRRCATPPHQQHKARYCITVLRLPSAAAPAPAAAPCPPLGPP